MNLRHKTLLLTTAPLLGLIVLLYSSLFGILQRSYLRLEHQDAQRNLQRVEEVLTGDLEQMQSLTEDWAAWNDSYAFIQDRNADFIASNLHKNAFESLGLNFIIFVNRQGEMIYGGGYDLEAEAPIPIPADLQRQLKADSPLMQFPHLAYHHQGLITVNHDLLLVIVEPILRSDSTGPAQGA